jgi:hypothetical protein
MADGLQKMQDLHAAGYSADEVTAWQTRTAVTLRDAGFSQDEINSYFGMPTPNSQVIADNVKANARHYEHDGPNSPLGFFDSIKAGFENSVSALAVRGKLPDLQMKGDEPWYSRIASSGAQMVGDAPFMLLGGLAGGAAGGAAGAAVAAPTGEAAAPATTPIGAVVGGWAGAMAVPTAMRDALIDSYKNGNFKSWGDFWQRYQPIMWDTTKQAVVGAVAGAAGKVAGVASPALEKSLISRFVGPTAATTAAKMSAEVTAMTAAGDALNGKMPEPKDFIDNAVLMLAAHGATAVAGQVISGSPEQIGKVSDKLMDTYRATGITPDQVLQQAKSEPTVAQDLLSDKPGIPEIYKPMIDPELRPEVQADAKGEPTAIIKAGESEVEQVSPVLEGDYMPEGEKPAGIVEATPTLEIESTPNSLDDARKQILSRIGEQPERKSSFNFYRDFVDRLDPINNAVKTLAGKDVEAGQNPYKLMRLMSGSAGRGRQAIENSAYEFNTLKDVGVSFKDVMESVKGKEDDFRAFLVSLRALELHDRGIETGVPMEAAAMIAKADGPKFREPFLKMQKFQDANLAYLRDSGILSGKAYAAMHELNQAYIPFNRILDETPGIGLGGERNPIHEIKGSDRYLRDPLVSVYLNTYAYIHAAEMNEAVRSFARLADGTENPADFYKPVDETALTKSEPGTASATTKDPALVKFLEENGLKDAPDDVKQTLAQMRQPLGKNQVGYFDNGKYKVIEVDPDVAKAFSSLPYQQHGLLFKMLAFPAKLFRAGLTSPDFILRHFERNQVSAFALSDTNNTPFFDTFRGLVSVLGKDEAYQKWLKSGGAMVSIVDMDAHNIQKEMARLVGEDPDTNFMDRVWNLAKTPISLLHALQSTLENGTRVGAFRRALGEDTGRSNILDAGFRARNVAPDPARIGDATRNMNAVTALFNIEIQHTDQLVTALRERPLGTLAKIFATITIPSALLWLHNHDKQEWQEAHQWERDAFWLVPMGNYTMRIPKPFLTGFLFGSGVERMLDAIAGNDPKRQGEEFATDLFEQGVPHVIPNAIQPVLEQVTNYSFFRGAPLVPDSIQGLLPEYRYTEYTSELSKALGRMVASVPYSGSAASPMVIENYVRQWTGGMGMYALQLADASLRKSKVLPDPPKPDDTLADIPVVKAFVVRYPSATADSIEHFYEQYEEKKMVSDTFDRMLQQGNSDVAMQVLQRDPTAMMNLDGIRSALSQQSQLVRMIYKDPSMKGDQKRQLIDGIYFQMIQMAHQGNQVMATMEKQAPQMYKPTPKDVAKDLAPLAH